jgi:hypothetical protein
MAQNLKKSVRKAVARVPGAKIAVRKARDLRFYWHDFSTYGSAMNWRTLDRDYRKISSELIFQYHKLEKGLCLPPPFS